LIPCARCQMREGPSSPQRRQNLVSKLQHPGKSRSVRAMSLFTIQ